MGYTRYWFRTEKKYGEDFVKQVEQVLADCQARGIIIRNGFGEGSPVVTLEKIWINGNEETDTAHETFAIINTDSEYYRVGSDFCKTARKPYDYAVRQILKIAQEQGIVDSVGSDGVNDEIISDNDYLIEEVIHKVYIKFAYGGEGRADDPKLKKIRSDVIDADLSAKAAYDKFVEIIQDDEDMMRYLNILVKDSGIQF